ncbi:conserved hypothetical protein [Desulfonatronospira thiodismutans ASO3-1]|uniref:Uncharacterized protein n=1 Tax=Desulfonatronospira thiodismutans ASO3-1 TaxID=555779 RepID=D6SNW6_9BACT|nr:hypothetical protein [Desulfonatronospira thiodismutans]EFI34442.1 conserved hypothetical protein [Desulfonatronospira thiodismutans ASO3-1]
MHKVYEVINDLYDALHYVWEHDRTRQTITTVLIGTFLVTLTLTELNRFGMLPDNLGERLPTNPFYSVKLAFTLLLVNELISLIFILPCSVSRAVGKQLEILCLIFLRNAFKELSYFTEPIVLVGQLDAVLRIGANALGAVIIFVLLHFYYRQYVKRSGKGSRGERVYRFISVKKLVSMILLLIFTILGIYHLSFMWMHGEGIPFFAEIYTILVFSDVLLVLVVNRFFPGFNDIFRNSGFAVSTLLMRLSLTAPAFLNVVIGIGAALFALLLAMAYKRSTSGDP